jgi:hypothetical protein
MSRYYNGPKSDHFDGERFFDPQGVPPRSRRDLLRWHVDGRWRAPKAKWPVWAPRNLKKLHTKPDGNRAGLFA